MPHKYSRYWLAALVAAWAVDFLFFKKSIGISLGVWLLVLLGGGFLVARLEGIRAAWPSYLLAGAVLVFGAVPALRSEPFTVTISVLAALGLTLLLAGTFRSGYWTRFRLWNYISAILGVLFAAVSRPFQSRLTNPTGESSEGASGRVSSQAGSAWKTIRPVLVGLLLALPVVAVLAGLLASADPIFSDDLSGFFGQISLERLPEYLFRGIYILVLAFLFTGVLLHALLPKNVAQRPDPDQAPFKPFLGFTEAGIVLACVDLLFIIFVVIQFRYLFGGQANISAAGYTYADYARRGFGELVAVAMISLGLYLALGAITRRENAFRQWGFRGLALALILLVLVILASAMQRLVLYEQAYGFTRLRVYTLFFIPWLAVLLIVTAILEAARHSGRFALAALAVTVGFCLTFPILNVDALIVRLNVQRAIQGEDFDRGYLYQLSPELDPGGSRLVPTRRAARCGPAGVRRQPGLPASQFGPDRR